MYPAPAAPWRGLVPSGKLNKLAAIHNSRVAVILATPDESIDTVNQPHDNLMEATDCRRKTRPAA